MAINSNLILAKNIKIDKKNVCRYSGTEILALMRDQTHLIYEGSDYSFIQENRIYVSASYEACLYANYLAFCNPRYSDKYFFAWITKVIYTNDGTCEIEYEIDSWSTWYAHLTFKPCFVLREHVNDDTIGKHTIPEGLDVGEIISTDTRVQQMSSYVYIGILTNYKPVTGGGYTFNGISMYNRTVFGNGLIIFNANTQADFGNISAFIKRANLDGHIEDIHDMFFIPYEVVPVESLVQSSFDYKRNTYNYWELPYSNGAWFEEFSFAKNYSFSDYTPKNNKLFCYPYNYLYVTNNNGDNNIYKFEDFSGNDVEFRSLFSISIGGSGMLVPKNYKGKSFDLDESVALGKLPTCGWSADSYTNWLTQNAVNEQNNLLRYGAEQASNILSLDIGAAAKTGANLVLDKMERFYSASLLPQKTAGTSVGDVSFGSFNTNYEISRKRPKKEYLQMIDSFFTRFGYKVNELKVPNISGRANWNYVEIGEGEICAYASGINHNGQVPQVDLDIINSQLRGGLTIWNDPENIGNFYLSNGII